MRNKLVGVVLGDEGVIWMDPYSEIGAGAIVEALSEDLVFGSGFG